MRHLKAGSKLGVNGPHRKAMIRSLTLALIEHETIKTTPARAKALRWYADRVVTYAKRGDVAGRRHIVQLLGSTQNTGNGGNRVRTAIARIYTELVPRFKDRPGGYTQIFRLVPRRAGDNAEMCIMRYLPAPDSKKDRPVKVKGKSKSDQKDSKKKIEASASEKKTDKSDKAHKTEKAPAHEDKGPQDQKGKKPKAKKEDEG